MHPGEQTDRDGDPIYRKNPNPKQAYRITMTVQDAPGPFEFVHGSVSYEMSNHEQCTPIDRFAGVWPKSKRDSLPMDFKKMDSTTYVGIIYTDAMVDADYYKKGICHWQINAVDVTLKATGAQAETRFQPALFKNELLQAQSVTTFFWKGGYPRDEMKNFPDTGQRDPDRFKPELRGDLFSISLSSEKVTP